MFEQISLMNNPPIENPSFKLDSRLKQNLGNIHRKFREIFRSTNPSEAEVK